MNNLIKKILVEWSYRLDDGMIDLENYTHFSILREVLSDMKLPSEVIIEVMGNITEENKPGDTWETESGWGAKNAEGDSKYFGKEEKDKAEKYAKGGKKETGTVFKKPKKKKLTKKEEEQLRIDNLKIDEKLSQANSSEETMKVINDIVNDEHDRVYKGIYGPGGGAATYGETNYSQATNEFIGGKVSKFGEEPSKPKPKPEHIERFNRDTKNAKKKRIEYAKELGINPYDDNDPKQKEMVVNELARRETWVDEKMEEHKDTKVQKDKFNTKEKIESQREWLRTGFDGGRATSEDLYNDPDYGGVTEPPEPVSMLMTKANQELVKKALERELKACEDLENESDRDDCVEHYEDQLKNFEKGMSDHDTGAVYFDKDGRLRFLNTSNKKSKSMKDPQWNSTAEARIPKIQEAVSEMEASGDYPGMDGKEVVAIVNKGQEEATQISVEANESLMINKGVNIETTQGDSSGNGADSGGMSIVAKRLPGTKKWQNEDSYFEKAKNHKKTQAKLEELYPDTRDEDKWSDEQVLIAIQEVNKSGNGAYTIHGKFLNKIGQMYNEVNDRFKELKEQGLSDEEAYKQMSEESKGVYTAEELKQIRESKNLQEAGKLNNNYKSSMERAHNKVVSTSIEADGKYWEKEGPAPINDITGEPENGPHVRAYVKSYMEGMHWDTYIDNLDGKKNIQIGGYNVKPADFRSCLAKLSGYPEETNPPNKEWRKGLQQHLEKNLKIDADTNAVNIRGKDGEKTNSIGEDTWRSAGDAKKIAGGLGDDLINCIKDSASARKAQQRKQS